MKKSALALISILLLIVLVPITANAQGQNPPIPEPVGYVNDFANVCSVGQKQLLESTLSSLEKDTGAEVAVVTMQTCGNDPVSYRGELFNKWGIGKKGTDNGLLVMACIEQRSLEQETGYAMEVTLPDLLTRKAAEEHFVPQAKAGNICGGLVKIIQAYDPVIRGDEYVHATPQPSGGNPRSTLVMIFTIVLVVLLLLFLLSVLLGGSSGSGYSGGSSGSGYSGGYSSYSSSSDSSSSSSSSSSGSSFGGGSSGGGGSSTSW